MKHEFKVTRSKEQTVYTLESATGGGTSAGSIASVDSTLGGMQRRNPPGDNILAQEKKEEPPKPRNFVAKNAKMGGAGKMKDKSKTIPRHEKHKKPVAENFNGEYDDEAGMAHSNLLTTARAVMGLLKTIKDRDNLPEWGQEKIAKAEMMLVSVWDYLQSQKEQGIDPQVAEGYGRNRGYQHGFASPTAPRLGSRPNHGDDERHDLDDPELQRNRQEVTSYNITIDGKPINPKPIFGRSATIAWGKQQVAAGVDLSNAMISPVREGVAEGSGTNPKITFAQQTPGSWTRIDILVNGDVKFQAVKTMGPGHWTIHDQDGEVIGSGGNKTQLKASVLNYLSKQGVAEEWSQKYKSSINCSHPKGFSQKAHCAGKKKHEESVEMEMVCPECGMCETHGDHMMEVKQRLDAKCWKGKHKEGTKIKGGIRVNNCVPNEDIAEVSDELKNRYVSRASDDYGSANFAARASKSHPGLEKYSQDQEQRAKKRAAGLNRALSDKRRGVSNENMDQGNVSDTELDTIDPQDHDGMEGSFVKNQIHTMLRVLKHLEHAIGDEEDLPEWVQMKLSQAQETVVGVMNFMISDKEREVERQTGNDALMKEELQARLAELKTKVEGLKGAVAGGAVAALAGPEAIPLGMTIGDKLGDIAGRDKNKANEDQYMESLMNMLERSVSQAQHNLMVGVAHNPAFAQKVKVKQKVGQEFANADQGHDISKLPIRVPKKK